MSNEHEENEKISWMADNLKAIQQIAVSLIFIGGLGYATVDWLSTKFITKLEAQTYALKNNVIELDRTLAEVQFRVLQQELFQARQEGINTLDDKIYYRGIDKRLFLLKIKLRIIDAKESDYLIPNYLK